MKFIVSTLLFLFLSSCLTYNASLPTTPNPATVPQILTNESMDYSILENEISNDYRYINDKLLFVYDEKYNSTELKYKIFSQTGEVLFSNINMPINITYGRNYIKLNFPKTVYRNWGTLNPLLLEVTNEKNQKQYLKFIYSW